MDWLETVNDGESFCPAPGGEQPIWIPDLARSPILADTPARRALLDAGARALASVSVMSSAVALIAILSIHRRLVTDWTARQKAELEQLGRSLAPRCLEALRVPADLASADAV
jgi:GAF domain-containing protein